MPSRGAALDLGDVVEQSEYFHELTIRNQGDREADLVDLYPSCGCLAVEPSKLKIPPHGTAGIRLKLDLTPLTREQRRMASRPLAVAIWPIRKGQASREAGWQLSGTIHSRVTLDVLTLEFGDEPICGQTPRCAPPSRASTSRMPS